MAPLQYDGIIFDLDGTLWDSSISCSVGWNQALHSLGMKDKTVSPADVGSIMGMPHDKVFEKFFPNESKDQRDKIGDACYEGELEAIRREGGFLYPGVPEGLNELKKHYPLFIVSNCLVSYLETFFAFSQLKGLFTDYECHGGTGLGKAENISLVVKRNRLKAAAYVGDTAGDQIAATKAGVDYYHVDYGFGVPDKDCLTFARFSDVTQFFTNR